MSEHAAVAKQDIEDNNFLHEKMIADEQHRSSLKLEQANKSKYTELGYVVSEHMDQVSEHENNKDRIALFDLAELTQEYVQTGHDIRAEHEKTIYAIKAKHDQAIQAIKKERDQAIQEIKDLKAEIIAEVDKALLDVGDVECYRAKRDTDQVIMALIETLPNEAEAEAEVKDVESQLSYLLCIAMSRSSILMPKNNLWGCLQNIITRKFPPHIYNASDGNSKGIPDWASTFIDIWIKENGTMYQRACTYHEH